MSKRMAGRKKGERERERERERREKKTIPSLLLPDDVLSNPTAVVWR